MCGEVPANGRVGDASGPHVAVSLAQAREDVSPLGELAAGAATEGDRFGQQRIASHGYYYRVLTRQGPSAPRGALDYGVRGRKIGGYAQVA